MSLLGTASGLERKHHCPASAVLPQAPHTGDAALYGTANHQAIEKSLLRREVESLPEVVKLAINGAKDWEAEAAYLIDISGRYSSFLGCSIDRAYPELTDDQLALTVDLVVNHRDGLVAVWDWKSRKRVTEAQNNWQLKAAALAVLWTYCVPQVMMGIGYLDDGEFDTWIFDSFDATTFVQDLRDLQFRIKAAKEQLKPSVRSGPWCDYCPAMAHCPAHTRQALALIGELESIETAVAHMTPEQVGQAWEKLRMVERIAERVNDSLRLRAKREVIPLPSGKRLAMVEKSRQSFLKDRAIARIRELGGKTEDLYGRTTYFQVTEVKMEKK